MKLNKIFGLLAVALCATAQLDAGAGRRAAARGNSSTSTRKAPAQPSAPVETSIPVTTPVAAQAPVTTSTPDAVSLTRNILDNLEKAANINSDVSTAIRQWMEIYLTRTGAQPSAADTAILGRLGNSEYDKCCETCAKKHKKTNKKGHAHTKKSKSNKKEHAKKNNESN
jgi:hypothetical protein